MVCLGNICRSPLAEAILRDKAERAQLEWFIDSAGTNGLHVGEAPHPLSQKIARKHGIDISSQRARKFVAEDFLRFDKIYTMAGDVLEEIKVIAKDKYDESKIEWLMNECYPGKNLEVPDPWYGPESGYQKVYELIQEACKAIIKNHPEGDFESSRKRNT